MTMKKATDCVGEGDGVVATGATEDAGEAQLILWRGKLAWRGNGKSERVTILQVLEA